MKEFVDFINTVGAIRESPTNEVDYIESEMYALDEYLNQVEYFYRLADERSIHFVDNIIRKMDDLDEKLAVMINGGFHADIDLAELKRRDITHVSIKPRVTRQDVVNPYFELLQDRQTPLEKLLAKNQTIMAIMCGWSKQGFRQETALSVKTFAYAIEADESSNPNFEEQFLEYKKDHNITELFKIKEPEAAKLKIKLPNGVKACHALIKGKSEINMVMLITRKDLFSEAGLQKMGSVDTKPIGKYHLSLFSTEKQAAKATQAISVRNQRVSVFTKIGEMAKTVFKIPARIVSFLFKLPSRVRTISIQAWLSTAIGIALAIYTITGNVPGLMAVVSLIVSVYIYEKNVDNWNISFAGVPRVIEQGIVEVGQKTKLVSLNEGRSGDQDLPEKITSGSTIPAKYEKKRALVSTFLQLNKWIMVVILAASLTFTQGCIFTIKMKYYGMTRPGILEKRETLLPRFNSRIISKYPKISKGEKFTPQEKEKVLQELIEVISKNKFLAVKANRGIKGLPRFYNSNYYLENLNSIIVEAWGGYDALNEALLHAEGSEFERSEINIIQIAPEDLVRAGQDPLKYEKKTINLPKGSFSAHLEEFTFEEINRIWKFWYRECTYRLKNPRKFFRFMHLIEKSRKSKSEFIKKMISDGHSEAVAKTIGTFLEKVSKIMPQLEFSDNPMKFIMDEITTMRDKKKNKETAPGTKTGGFMSLGLDGNVKKLLKKFSEDPGKQLKGFREQVLFKSPIWELWWQAFGLLPILGGILGIIIANKLGIIAPDDWAIILAGDMFGFFLGFWLAVPIFGQRHLKKGEFNKDIFINAVKLWYIYGISAIVGGLYIPLFLFGGGYFGYLMLIGFVILGGIGTVITHRDINYNKLRNLELEILNSIVKEDRGFVSSINEVISSANKQNKLPSEVMENMLEAAANTKLIKLQTELAKQLLEKEKYKEAAFMAMPSRGKGEPGRMSVEKAAAVQKAKHTGKVQRFLWNLRKTGQILFDSESRLIGRKTLLMFSIITIIVLAAITYRSDKSGQIAEQNQKLNAPIIKRLSLEAKEQGFTVDDQRVAMWKEQLNKHLTASDKKTEEDTILYYSREEAKRRHMALAAILEQLKIKVEELNLPTDEEINNKWKRQLEQGDKGWEARKIIAALLKIWSEHNELNKPVIKRLKSEARSLPGFVMDYREQKKWEKRLNQHTWKLGKWWEEKKIKQDMLRENNEKLNAPIIERLMLEAEKLGLAANQQRVKEWEGRLNQFPNDAHDKRKEKDTIAYELEQEAKWRYMSPARLAAYLKAEAESGYLTVDKNQVAKWTKQLEKDKLPAARRIMDELDRLWALHLKLNEPIIKRLESDAARLGKPLRKDVIRDWERVAEWNKRLNQHTWKWRKEQEEEKIKQDMAKTEPVTETRDERWERVEGPAFRSLKGFPDDPYYKPKATKSGRFMSLGLDGNVKKLLKKFSEDPGEQLKGFREQVLFKSPIWELWWQAAGIVLPALGMIAGAIIEPDYLGIRGFGGMFGIIAGLALGVMFYAQRHVKHSKVSDKTGYYIKALSIYFPYGVLGFVLFVFLSPTFLFNIVFLYMIIGGLLIGIYPTFRNHRSINRDILRELELKILAGIADEEEDEVARSIGGEVILSAFKQKKLPSEVIENMLKSTANPEVVDPNVVDLMSRKQKSLEIPSELVRQVFTEEKYLEMIERLKLTKVSDKDKNDKLRKIQTKLAKQLLEKGKYKEAAFMAMPSRGKGEPGTKDSTILPQAVRWLLAVPLGISGIMMSGFNLWQAPTPGSGLHTTLSVLKVRLFKSKESSFSGKLKWLKAAPMMLMPVMAITMLGTNLFLASWSIIAIPLSLILYIVHTRINKKFLSWLENFFGGSMFFLLVTHIFGGLSIAGEEASAQFSGLYGIDFLIGIGVVAVALIVVSIIYRQMRSKKQMRESSFEKTVPAIGLQDKSDWYKTWRIIEKHFAVLAKTKLNKIRKLDFEDPGNYAEFQLYYLQHPHELHNFNVFINHIQNYWRLAFETAGDTNNILFYKKKEMLRRINIVCLRQYYEDFLQARSDQRIGMRSQGPKPMSLEKYIDLFYTEFIKEEHAQQFIFNHLRKMEIRKGQKFTLNYFVTHHDEIQNEFIEIAKTEAPDLVNKIIENIAEISKRIEKEADFDEGEILKKDCLTFVKQVFGLYSEVKKAPAAESAKFKQPSPLTPGAIASPLAKFFNWTLSQAGRYEGWAVAGFYLIPVMRFILKDAPTVSDFGWLIILPAAVIFVAFLAAHYGWGVLQYDSDEKKYKSSHKLDADQTAYQRFKLALQATMTATVSSLLGLAVVAIIAATGWLGPVALVLAVLAVPFGSWLHERMNLPAERANINFSDTKKYQSLEKLYEDMKIKPQNSKKPLAGHVIGERLSEYVDNIFGKKYNLMKNVRFLIGPAFSVSFQEMNPDAKEDITPEYLKEETVLVISMPKWLWNIAKKDKNIKWWYPFVHYILGIRLKLSLSYLSLEKRFLYKLIESGWDRKGKVLKYILEKSPDVERIIEPRKERPQADKDLPIGLEAFLQICNQELGVSIAGEKLKAELSSDLADENMQQEIKAAKKNPRKRAELFRKHPYWFQKRRVDTMLNAAQSGENTLARMLMPDLDADKSLKTKAEKALSAAIIRGDKVDLQYDFTIADLEMIHLQAFPEMAERLLAEQGDALKNSPVLEMVLKEMKNAEPGKIISISVDDQIRELVKKYQGERKEELTHSFDLGKTADGDSAYAIANTAELEAYKVKTEAGTITFYLSTVGQVKVAKDGDLAEVIRNINSQKQAIKLFAGRDSLAQGIAAVNLKRKLSESAKIKIWISNKLRFGLSSRHSSVAAENPDGYFNYMVEQLEADIQAQMTTAEVKKTFIPFITELKRPGSDVQKAVKAVLKTANQDQETKFQAQEQLAHELRALVTNYSKIFQSENIKENEVLLAENILNIEAFSRFAELMNPIMVVERNYATPDKHGELQSLIEELGIRQTNVSVPYVLRGRNWGAQGAYDDTLRENNYIPNEENTKKFRRKAIKVFAGAA